MPSRDLVSIVESIYDLEDRSEKTWLRDIAAHASGVLGRDVGAYGLTYDASSVECIRFSKPAFFKVTDPELIRLLEVEAPRVYRENPDLVEMIFRRIAYAASADLPMQQKLTPILRSLASCGIRTILGINGINIDGRGAHVGVLVRQPPTKIGGDVLSRLSSHLAAASRLRSRLAPTDEADAVLEPSGKITHAVRDAKVRSARVALADAAVRLDRLRAAGRRRDPERALGAWRALVDGRWSLVDHFEKDGRRYVIAQRNDPPTGPFELLTDREKQVVALAAVGHANKMIAYELGIAISTVSVLLSRAARKVGAASRRQLIATYERRASPNEK